MTRPRLVLSRAKAGRGGGMAVPVSDEGAVAVLSGPAQVAPLVGHLLDAAAHALDEAHGGGGGGGSGSGGGGSDPDWVVVSECVRAAAAAAGEPWSRH